MDIVGQGRSGQRRSRGFFKYWISTIEVYPLFATLGVRRVMVQLNWQIAHDRFALNSWHEKVPFWNQKTSV
jgi:hypothetical protein